MAVFAWLPTCPEDALPPPQNTYNIEKTRKLARRRIIFQNEDLKTPATGPNAVVPSKVRWPCIS
eukprot:9045783-Pyramimonas_sp.AAC.1